MTTFYELRFARFVYTGARESLVENIASIRAKTGKNALLFVRIFRIRKHFSEPERQVFRGEWCVIADNFVPLHAKSGFFARPKTSATAVEQGFQGV